MLTEMLRPREEPGGRVQRGLGGRREYSRVADRHHGVSDGFRERQCGWVDSATSPGGDHPI